MVAFFVPKATGNVTDEESYAELAAFAGCAPLPIEERIASISWWHDGERWTATVGETLRGVRPREIRRRGQPTRTVEDPVRDRAKVLAIFRGLTVTVVTDAFVPGWSAWANPFLAGDNAEVTYFDPPTPTTGEEGRAAGTQEGQS